jgi:hypothetical protein
VRIRTGRDRIAAAERIRRGVLGKRGTVLLLVACAFIAACNDSKPASGWDKHRNERRGYTLSLAPGWHLAKRSLSPSLVDPVEILSVATFPIRRGEELCHALAGIPPDHALVTLQERSRASRGDPTFPPRPANFERDPRLPGNSELPYCLRGYRGPPIPMLDYWFGFRDAGRAFHVFVGIGKEAPEEVRREAFGILDSLRLERSGAASARAPVARRAAGAGRA